MVIYDNNPVIFSKKIRVNSRILHDNDCGEIRVIDKRLSEHKGADVMLYLTKEE